MTRPPIFSLLDAWRAHTGRKGDCKFQFKLSVACSRLLIRESARFCACHCDCSPAHYYFFLTCRSWQTFFAGGNIKWLHRHGCIHTLNNRAFGLASICKILRYLTDACNKEATEKVLWIWTHPHWEMHDHGLALRLNPVTPRLPSPTGQGLKFVTECENPFRITVWTGFDTSVYCWFLHIDM